jgi:FAD/FMN-containing dehydrogenase
MLRKLLIALFVLLLVAVPALAQGVEPVVEEPELAFGYVRTDIVIIGVLVIVLAAFVFFRDTAVTAVKEVARIVNESGIGATGITIDLEPLEQKLDDLFAKTPNVVDDALWGEVKGMIKDVIREALDEAVEEKAQALAAQSEDKG